MNVTTLMWFAAANIKCGQSPSLMFMTVPYICKTKHAYNTTATEETPKKFPRKIKNKSIHNDSVQTPAKTHGGRKVNYKREKSNRC